MAIRIIDAPSRRGSVNSRLDDLAGALLGTHVGPPGRTGVIGSQLDGISSAIQGTFSKPGRTASIVSTLDPVTAVISGTSTPPNSGTAPSTPTGLAATIISSSQINLGWNASVSPLAAPSDLWMDLQGKTSAGGDDSSVGVPLAPNTLTIAWPDVAGRTGFRIYRSVDGGAETLYQDAWNPAAVGGNVRFTDTAATGCVNGTAGPVAGVYYGAHSYRYRVSTLNGAVEGPKTLTGQKYYVFNAAKGGTNAATVSASGTPIPAGGFKWFGDFTGTVTATNYGATSPQESGLSWGNHPTAGSAYILPVAGGIYTHWNLWMGSIGNGFLYLDIWRNDVTTSLGLHGEVVGDLAIQPTGALHPNQPSNLDVQQYITNPPLVANAWKNHKIPIAAFMTLAGTLQHQVYKFLLQINGGALADYFLDNVYYGE